MGCFYCGDTTKETRPYGPGGARVCFDCAFATPERKATTDAALDLKLAAAMDDGPCTVVFGGADGPVRAGKA